MVPNNLTLQCKSLIRIGLLQFELGRGRYAPFARSKDRATGRGGTRCHSPSGRRITGAEGPSQSRRSLPTLLSDREIDVPQNEECGENPDQRGHFAEFDGSDFHHRIRDETQADSGADAKRQRCGENGDERPKRLAELAPFYLLD